MIIVQVDLKDWGLDSRLIRDGWMMSEVESSAARVIPSLFWIGGQGQLRPIGVNVSQAEVVYFVMFPILSAC
jgi:hypothetical protein